MKHRHEKPPTHPGEVLRDKYLVPLARSANQLAQSMGIPANRVSAIVNGTRGVTAETALLLSRELATTPEFWMHLQTAFDLYVAEQKLGGR